MELFYVVLAMVVAIIGSLKALNAVDGVQVLLGFKGTGSKNLTGIQNPLSNSMDASETYPFTVGTSANQINEIYDEVRSIAASSTDNLDLSGVLTNILNTTGIALTKIKAIKIHLLTSDETVNGIVGTAASSITIGGHATAPWLGGPFQSVSSGAGTDKYVINNGESWVHVAPSAAGMAVTATTGDLLKIVNNDGGVAAKVRISIIGCD